jgi:threonine aldolase
MKRTFASDNYSGVHPVIMQKIVEANMGHCPAYGLDPITVKAKEKFKEIFGDVEVFFVYNGTGSNVLALEAMKGRATCVLCSESAHIFQDEAGAPTKVTGMQLLPVPSKDGKFDINEAERFLSFKGSFHKPEAHIISITQATELGGVYTPDEIKNISAFAKRNNMLLHMDGTRISNAAVALGCSPKEMTADCGVDVLSYGGTKNGLMFGEAIIFFNKDLAKDFRRLRKQNLQLNSKMRFISAQYLGLLENNLWYENAFKANAMAKYMKEKLVNLGIEVTNDVAANIIFAKIPMEVIEEMQEFSYFYLWNEYLKESRFVMSFDITKEDVDIFMAKLEDVLKKESINMSGRACCAL